MSLTTSIRKLHAERGGLEEGRAGVPSLASELARLFD
jgi:hypothetical protein